MKKSKALVAKSKSHGLTVIKQILVASKSVPGDYHTVLVYSDKSVSCECIGGGLYGMDCRHQKRVKQMIKKEGV